LTSPFLFWGDRKTPTIRSDFAYQQYEKVIQALAYETALEAIQNLKTKNFTMKLRTEKGAIRELETDNWTFKFYSKHVSFSPCKLTKSSWGDRYYNSPLWNCQVEEKLYTDSPHSSKIHFDVLDGEDLAKKREPILGFLNKLMAGVKPVQRFSLGNLPKPEMVKSLPGEKFETLRKLGKIQ
jgi:hypothetical protein